jgi:hypothetical protein
MTIEEIALKMLTVKFQVLDRPHTITSVGPTGLDCFSEPPNIRHEASKQGFSNTIRHGNSVNHTGPDLRELRYYGSWPPRRARCESLVFHRLDRTRAGIGYNPPSVLSPTTANVAVLRPVATFFLQSMAVTKWP